MGSESEEFGEVKSERGNSSEFEWAIGHKAVVIRYLWCNKKNRLSSKKKKGSLVIMNDILSKSKVIYKWFILVCSLWSSSRNIVVSAAKDQERKKVGKSRM